MSDMDVFAAMGIAGFGKKQKQRQLDPKRFDKNKREEVCLLIRVVSLGCIYETFSRYRLLPMNLHSLPPQALL